MKKLLILIALILWMMCTIILPLTMVSLYLIVKEDHQKEKSTWMQIGVDLKNALLLDKSKNNGDVYYSKNKRQILHD